MQDELTLIALVLVALLPGWFLLRSTVPDPLERAFASLTLGIAIMGWPALLSAKLGFFNGWLVVGSWLLVAGCWWLAVGRWPLAAGETHHTPRTTHYTPRTTHYPLSTTHYLLITLWLISACWLFFRPHEFVYGAADAGVYVNQAANLAQTGQLVIDDTELANLDPALRPLFLRERPAGEGTQYYLFPAFNVDDDVPGRVIPEFFPLHPVWQAVAYQFGGVQAALKIVGLWALLGSLAIYLNLRRIVPWPFAIAGLVILSLNAMQVWFARYPVSESLNQYLLWAGVWALGNWLSDDVRPAQTFQVSETWKVYRVSIWPLLSALTLGQLLFVRIDALFLLAIPVLVALWFYLTGQWATRPGKGWFFVPYALLAIHAVWHITTTSAPYFTRLANYVELVASTLPAGLFLIPIPLAILALYLFRKWDGRRKTKDSTPTPHPLPSTLYPLITITILALALFAWFIRPTLSPPAGYTDWYTTDAIPTLNHENLIRLGWYLSPVGIWLGIFGMCLMVWRLNRRLFIILSVGAFYTLLYQWRIQANPHQIYAMRRYLPAVLPFFIIAATFFIANFRFLILDFRARFTRHSPFTIHHSPFTISLSLIWLVATLLSVRPFISQIDQHGLITQLDAFNATLDPNAVLLFNDQKAISQGDTVGTALQYQYGHTVYTLREDPAGYTPALQQAIAQWQSARRTVYWLNDPTWLDQQAIPYTTTTTTLTFPFLETPYDHKPQDLLTANWVLTLSEIGRLEIGD